MVPCGENHSRSRHSGIRGCSDIASSVYDRRRRELWQGAQSRSRFLGCGPRLTAAPRLHPLGLELSAEELTPRTVPSTSHELRAHPHHPFWCLDRSRQFRAFDRFGRWTVSDTGWGVTTADVSTHSPFTSVNSKQWARQQGIPPVTASRCFSSGTPPVPAGESVT